MNYAVKAFRFNAIDYLTKPLNPIELKEAVNKAFKEIDYERFSTFSTIPPKSW